MNKALSKSIMIRINITRIPLIENINSYKKQRNHCVKLLKLSKKKLYNNLKPKFITDTKKFWKCIKPLF